MTDQLAPWTKQRPVSGEVGSWINEAAGSWGTVGGIATTSFDSYAVLPNGTDGYTLSSPVAAHLRDAVRQWVAEDEPCFQALWQGYGELGGGTRL
ncbi:hypothetical protein [Demetria terragena]|uniref:hypothetical protein n=1 Tax=Demetria terragena TaxID=63959 RepID=UPI0003768532|nr:hypothetical protein [Demetria terragena]